MKKTLKFLNNMLTAILILFLLSTVALTVSSRMHNGTPQFFGNKIMFVLSGSMEPKIKTGSLIVVKPVTDTTTLNKGDVITFESPIQKGVIITHRIIDKQGEGQFTEYLTKGDNNNAPDPRPVPNTNIHGQYANITIPYMGYFFNFLQSRNGIIILIVIPAVLFCIYQAFSLFRQVAMMDDEQKKPDSPESV